MRTSSIRFGLTTMLTLGVLAAASTSYALTCVGPSCGLTLDHFKCYQARTTPGTSKFVPLRVTLQDQFETVDTTVKKPATICNPVKKNGGTLFDATAHLACYATKDDRIGAFPRVDLTIANQFGEQRVTVKKPYQLCVPTEKGKAPAAPTPSALAVDHYRCFKAKPAKGSPLVDGVVVSLEDQFETRNAVVRKCLRFCVPVSKNGELILSSDANLTCYKLVRESGDTVPPFGRIDLNVTNQFGDLKLTARALPHLCVPTISSPSGAFVD